MMSIEPRNEQLMLRQFRKAYPSYNLNALMRKRYEELMDARAFLLCFANAPSRNGWRDKSKPKIGPANRDGNPYWILVKSNLAAYRFAS